MEEKNAVSFVLIVTKVTKHIFTKFFGTRIAGGNAFLSLRRHLTGSPSVPSLLSAAEPVALRRSARSSLPFSP